MQSYDDFRLFPTKEKISGREAYGAYTKFATETANLAITVAKPTKKSASLPLIPLLQKTAKGSAAHRARIPASPMCIITN